VIGHLGATGYPVRADVRLGRFVDEELVCEAVVEDPRVGREPLLIQNESAIKVTLEVRPSLDRPRC
jgi:hypothetical protein